MGNVRDDINGNMTMAVDTAYSGGVVLDPTVIEEIKTEIVAGLSSNLEWVRNNTARNMDEIAKRGATGQAWNVQWAALMEAAGFTPPEEEQQILDQLKKLKEGQIDVNF